VFLCYHQHDYLRGLAVFLAETWARALKVLRWKSSRIQVLSETGCPPDPMNNVKIFKGWPLQDLQSWYNCGINHVEQADFASLK